LKKSSTGDQGNQAASVAELQQFRSLLQNHPLPIFIVDISSKDPLQYTFLATNRAAELLYGYSEEEFLQMPLTQLRPAEDLGGLVRTAVRTGILTTLQFCYLHDKCEDLLAHMAFEFVGGHGILLPIPGNRYPERIASLTYVRNRLLFIMNILPVAIQPRPVVE
jgi:PAS domain-containing protein